MFILDTYLLIQLVLKAPCDGLWLDGAPLTAALASRWKDVGFRKGGFYLNLAPSLSGPMTSTPPFALPCSVHSQPKRSWRVLQSVVLHRLSTCSSVSLTHVIKTHRTSAIPSPPPSSGIQIIPCDVTLTSQTPSEDTLEFIIHRFFIIWTGAKAATLSPTLSPSFPSTRPP